MNDMAIFLIFQNLYKLVDIFLHIWIVNIHKSILLGSIHIYLIKNLIKLIKKSCFNTTRNTYNLFFIDY